MRQLSLVEAPIAAVLSVEEAKLQCRVELDLHDEDTWFADAIAAATDRVEARTGRQLVHARWRLTLDAWPCEGWIEIPRAPLVSVQSISYVDAAGVTQTWSASAYRVDAPAGPRAPRGRVSLAYGETWPTVQTVAGAIAIDFTAGYGTTGAKVPAALRQAMKLLVAHWYENREDVIVGTITSEIQEGFEALVRDFVSLPTQRG